MLIGVFLQRSGKLRNRKSRAYLYMEQEIHDYVMKAI